MIVWRGVSETTRSERHAWKVDASVKERVGGGTPEAVMNRPTETYTDRRRETVLAYSIDITESAVNVATVRELMGVSLSIE